MAAQETGSRLTFAGYALIFLAAAAIGVRLIDPMSGGHIGYDAASSVLYFERIIRGQHLETVVNTTPKPLLTSIYGALYALTGGWSAIALVTILVYASCAVLTVILVRRFGGIAAATFAGVAVVCSPYLVTDVALSYAVAWAYLGCLIAGLLLTGRPLRYGLAGVALGVAALARAEVLLMVLAGLAVLAVSTAVARYRHQPGPPARAWLIGVGLIAIPIQLIHDWLVSGDPMYSVHVLSGASTLLPLMTPGKTVQYLLIHLVGFGPLLVLGAIGWLFLIRRGSWAMLIGVLAMGPGVAAFLVFLSARHIYISARYLDPIALAMVVAAGVGFGAIAVPDAGAVAKRIVGRAAQGPLLVVVAAATAVLITAPVIALDFGAVASMSNDQVVHANARALLPRIRAALSSVPDVATWPGPAPGRPPSLVVPTLLQPQFAVDLRIPITQVGITKSNTTDVPLVPVAGQVIYHDRHLDPYHADSFLEVSVPTTVGDVVLVPIVADPVHGMWLVRVEPKS